MTLRNYLCFRETKPSLEYGKHERASSEATTQEEFMET